MPERFTIADAVGWTVLALVLFLFPVALVPAGRHDFVTSVAIQALVLLATCALFASRRRGQGWSEVFAMRSASLPTVLAALLLGVALCPAAERIALVVQSSFPLPKELLEAHEKWMRVRSPLHGALLVLLAAGVGPFVEELFFRGALFTAQRRHATTFEAVGTNALLFTLFHPEPRMWAPILPVAVAIAAVRSRTGSLFPALAVHAGFNGTSLALSRALPGDSGPGLPLVAGGVAAAALASALLWRFGNGAVARQARELDGGLPS